MSHCTLHNYQEEVVEEVEVEPRVVLLGGLGVVPEFVWIGWLSSSLSPSLTASHPSRG